MSLALGHVTIFGATGPTGKHLARNWLDRGVTVRVVSRSEANLERAFGRLDAERVSADAMVPEQAERAVAGTEVVFDCIGLPMEALSDHPPTARNLAAACRAAGARCVHVSSYWAYMPIRFVPVDEKHPREGGPAPAELRREAEDILQQAGAAVVNLPDFYGPEMQISLLNWALADALAGKPATAVGPATVEREYAFVPDAMQAVVELSLHEEAYGERWVVPGAGPISISQAMTIAGGCLGRKLKSRGTPPWLMKLMSVFSAQVRSMLPLVPTYSRPIAYDGSKLRRLIGDVPTTAYEQGIPATLEWLADNPLKTPMA